MADKSEKKSHKAITLHSMIKIIKLSDEDVLLAGMGRRLGFPPTSVN
jgi:uncharacterized protein